MAFSGYSARAAPDTAIAAITRLPKIFILIIVSSSWVSLAGGFPFFALQSSHFVACKVPYKMTANDMCVNPATN
jgi:hypothetical protein